MIKKIREGYWEITVEGQPTEYYEGTWSGALCRLIDKQNAWQQMDVEPPEPK